MNSEFFRGRKWMATVSLAAAMAATCIYGATTGRLPFEHATPTIKVATRSEASAGRGYSAVVKRVVPAVVNISISKVVKQQTGFEKATLPGRYASGNGSVLSVSFSAMAPEISSKRLANAPRKRSDRA
jgi:S1-C subfamily serine protease